MKQFFLLVLLSVCCRTAIAQQATSPLDTRKNAAFVHLMGPSIVYSLGYEGALMVKKRHALVINGGGMVLLGAVGLHGGLSYLYFIKRNALELGMNVGYISDKRGWLDTENPYPVINVGYRYYTRNDKLFLKGGVDLMMGTDFPNDVFPYPYFGIGFRF